jgi:hypothetical protein
MWVQVHEYWVVDNSWFISGPYVDIFEAYDELLSCQKWDNNFKSTWNLSLVQILSSWD